MNFADALVTCLQVTLEANKFRQDELEKEVAQVDIQNHPPSLFVILYCRCTLIAQQFLDIPIAQQDQRQIQDREG